MFVDGFCIKKSTYIIIGTWIVAETAIVKKLHGIATHSCFVFG